LAGTVYEGMFLLDSHRFGRDPEGVAGQIPNMIREAGGEILVSRLWEERRLAYPIKGRRKGTYWLTYFRVEGGKLTQINRQCQLSDSVLRVLFLKIDPRIVDALVEHARAGQAKPASEAPPAKPSREKRPSEKKEEKKPSEKREEKKPSEKREKTAEPQAAAADKGSAEEPAASGGES
jgi:small subunit ribosomal protein S6